MITRTIFDGAVMMAEYVFNVDNGYLEGLVRGFRSGILSRGDYLNLVQCETVEGESCRRNFRGDLPGFLPPSDLKVQLQATDYGNFLQNEPSPIPVAIIDEKLRAHLVVEFQHIRNHSVPPLSTFLDYVTYVVRIRTLEKTQREKERFFEGCEGGWVGGKLCTLVCTVGEMLCGEIRNPVETVEWVKRGPPALCVWLVVPLGTVCERDDPNCPIQL